MPGDVRRYFDPRFGFDFSKVRIHADTDAARDAQAIQARAYTIGRHIVFGAGEYSPRPATAGALLRMSWPTSYSRKVALPLASRRARQFAASL